MVRRLRKNFPGSYAWVLSWLLASLRVLAHAPCPADTCVAPSPPTISGSANAICLNESVTLTASDCAGIIIWSTGETGSRIVVRPRQTTGYTAVCRARPGCISCFAKNFDVRVNTPNPPVIATTTPITCPHGPVSLMASGCSGEVRWIDAAGKEQANRNVWMGALTERTTFRATCTQNGCASSPSVGLTIQTATPDVPIVSSDKSTICAGQSVQLTASGCLGTVYWSDGKMGASRQINPAQTVQYRALCQLGTCRSDSSAAVTVAVHSASVPANLLTSLTNTCPFQTTDLSKALADAVDPSLRYSFRTAASYDAPEVAAPGAVLDGTYYIVGRSVDGCYTEPVAVIVKNSTCINGVAPCLTSPAVVTFRIDSLDWMKGVVRLSAQLGGTAASVDWQSSGNGFFTDSGIYARYLLSEADRVHNEITFMAFTPDPDGDGPCARGSSTQTVAGPSAEIVGLSKQVSEPTWVTVDNRRLVELTYGFTMANMGKHPLSTVQLSDNLDRVFTNAGASIQSVQVRADSGLTVNEKYTGQGVDTVLINDGNLPVGAQVRTLLTVRLDVSNATTLTFANEALVQATDVSGKFVQDQSTTGDEADPDRNGSPTDNSVPTRVVLHSLQPEQTETVFIPEGFSPNGDGINDRFIIQQVPEDVTVQLDVYNRWGQLVYRQTDYKNDWDGTANQSGKSADAKQGLPDGTYYYQVRLSDGREFVRFLTLMR